MRKHTYGKGAGHFNMDDDVICNNSITHFVDGSNGESQEIGLVANDNYSVEPNKAEIKEEVEEERDVSASNNNSTQWIEGKSKTSKEANALKSLIKDAT